jgi:hypothetical protein
MLAGGEDADEPAPVNTFGDIPLHDDDDDDDAHDDNEEQESNQDCGDAEDGSQASLLNASEVNLLKQRMRRVADQGAADDASFVPTEVPI